MAATKASKPNIFNKAKETGTVESKGAKKSSIPVIKITEAQMPGFGKTLTEWAEKKAEITKAEADKTGLQASILEVANAEWVKNYKNTNKRESSLKFTGDGTDIVVTFTSADAYQKVTPDKASVLKELYGEDIITEADKYSLNAEMLNKYGAAISDFLMTSKKIEDADREKIIECDTVYAIKKGAVDELPALALKGKKTVEEVIADLGPTFQLK